MLCFKLMRAGPAHPAVRRPAGAREHGPEGHPGAAQRDRRSAAAASGCTTSACSRSRRGDLDIEQVRGAFQDLRPRVARRAGERRLQPPGARAGLNPRQIRCCAPIASTSCRSAPRSAKPISSRRWPPTRRSPAIRRSCSTPASIPRAAIARPELAELEAAFRAGLDEVASLDQDRILRRYLELIKATLRTNSYQRGPGRRAAQGLRVAQVRPGGGARTAAAAARRSRSSSTRRMSRACICAAARSRAAACAGRTGARTSAPRCWA